MGNNPWLNQMGIAVWVLDPSQLPPMQLRIPPDLSRLGESKQWRLKQQAKVFLRRIPDKLMRKYFCTIGPGTGIVVRFPPDRGKKGYYDFSPFFEQALVDVPVPEGDLTEERAEAWVRQVIDVVHHLRASSAAVKTLRF